MNMCYTGQSLSSFSTTILATTTLKIVSVKVFRPLIPINVPPGFNKDQTGGWAL